MTGTLANRRAAGSTGLLLALVVLGAAAWLLVPSAPALLGAGTELPVGSSYATGPDGLSRYAATLRSAGLAVHQRRLPLDAGAPVDTRAVLVVLDVPQLSAGEARAVADFVLAGGHAVVGGKDPGWLGTVVQHPPGWSPAGKVACRKLVTVPETAGVTDVVLSGGGTWATAGATLPVLACDGQVVATVASPGDNGGRVVALADSGPLRNRYLPLRDDRALGLAVLGGRRDVVFAEAAHGYTVPSGVAALPLRVRTALLGLIVAGGLAAAARRSSAAAEPAPGAPGPPADLGARVGLRPRDLPEVLRAALLDAAARRAGTAADPTAGPGDAAAVRRAADVLQLPEGDRALVTARRLGPEELPAAAALLARLAGLPRPQETAGPPAGGAPTDDLPPPLRLPAH
jgi:hypothetical protein